MHLLENSSLEQFWGILKHVWYNCFITYIVYSMVIMDVTHSDIPFGAHHRDTIASCCCFVVEIFFICWLSWFIFPIPCLQPLIQNKGIPKCAFSSFQSHLFLFSTQCQLLTSAMPIIAKLFVFHPHLSNYSI